MIRTVENNKQFSTYERNDEEAIFIIIYFSFFYGGFGS